MRETLLATLRCPGCSQEAGWDLTIAATDAREVRAGQIRCTQCASMFAIRDGIVDLLTNPPDYVAREAAGLARFADQMRRDGWDRERILQLPYVDLGYWCPQALGMEQLLSGRRSAPHLVAGARILDVGANTCWASGMFAERGMDVVALDISEHEMQGLRTAEWWFESKDVYFERVLSVMFAPALATESFDAVFCSEVLHHNHPSNLRRTLRELARILKPGGKLFVINEPVRALRSPKLRTRAGDVGQYDGHEHAYTRATYLRAVRRAGLDIELVAPRAVGALDDGTWRISPDTRPRDAFAMAFGHLIRTRSAIRRAYLAWRTYVDGVSLHLIATKPRSSV